MDTRSDTPPPQPAGWSPGAGAALAMDDGDLQRLAETFAVTPQAARLAVARVGTDFRALQRELGGRR